MQRRGSVASERTARTGPTGGTGDGAWLGAGVSRSAGGGASVVGGRGAPDPAQGERSRAISSPASNGLTT